MVSDIEIENAPVSFKSCIWEYFGLKMVTERVTKIRLFQKCAILTLNTRGAPPVSFHLKHQNQTFKVGNVIFTQSHTIFKDFSNI